MFIKKFIVRLASKKRPHAMKMLKRISSLSHPRIQNCWTSPNEKGKISFHKNTRFWKSYLSTHIRSFQYWVADSIYSICVLLERSGAKKCIDFFSAYSTYKSKFKHFYSMMVIFHEIFTVLIFLCAKINPNCRSLA